MNRWNRERGLLARAAGTTPMDANVALRTVTRRARSR
jgi:hypothetical protein